MVVGLVTNFLRDPLGCWRSLYLTNLVSIIGFSLFPQVGCHFSFCSNMSWSFLESKKSCSPPKSDKGKLQTYGVVQGLGKHFIAGHVGDLYRNIFKLLLRMDSLNRIYLLSEIKISGLRYQVKATLGMTNMGPFVEVHCSGPFPSYVNR